MQGVRVHQIFSSDGDSVPHSDIHHNTHIEAPGMKKPVQTKFIDGYVTIPKRISTIMKRKLTEEEREFNREKKKLHETHKKLKVGMISWDDVSEKDKALLKKYYGW